MAERVDTVHCTWDAEVADTDDVPGLATGADTLDASVEKRKVVIPERHQANGPRPADHAGDIAFAMIAQRHERAPVSA